jgi:pimeloyl-ACP methyl ester carboxylesterase
MTGASGGGYNTWITAALDDRILAAVPVVGTSDFAEQIQVCRPLDWYQAAEHCHFVPGLIRYANNHELLAMAAPKPLLIIAAERDQSFPIDGVRAVAEYGRMLYEAYGASNRIDLVVDSIDGHGYQRKKREAAYGWFLRWLMNKGDGSPYSEPPTDTSRFDALELRCFPPGQNQPGGPAIVSMVERLAHDLPVNSPDRQVDLESVLGTWPAPLQDRTGVRIEPVRLQRLVIPTESGISVPAFLLNTDGRVRGVIVTVADDGKESIVSDPVIGAAIEHGWAVCGVDPRGVGESSSAKTGWIFAVSLLLGENFVWRQAFDLHQVIDTLGSHHAFAGKSIGLYARGPNASLMAVYALARLEQNRRRPSPLSWFLLRDVYLSYHAFIERPKSLLDSFRLMPTDSNRTSSFDREIPSSFFVFDVLHSWDLRHLLALINTRGLIVNPIDGDGDRLSEPAALKLLPRSIEVVSARDPDKQIKDFLRRVLVDGD